MKIQALHVLGGLNTKVSPLVQPSNTATVLNGCNVSDKLGALRKDLGHTIVDATIQANKSIRGLFNFRQNPSTEKMLATVDDSTSDDTQLFYKTAAGSWTEIGAAETAWANVAGANVEMEGFIGYCFFVGHSSTDGFLPVGSLTGTTFSTATNVTDMAQGKYIKRYRDRLYVANCRYSGTDYPYRIYFSSVPTAGAITWTPASDFLDVDFGEQIMGIGTNWDRLMAFTEYSAYAYDQSIWKKVWDIGTTSHRTIQTHNSYMFFCNGDGAWVTTGGVPQNISGPVIDFFRSGSPRNFFATIVDEEYRVYVGTVTVDGITYTNCELIWNIPTSTWRTREYAQNMTVYARYNNSGVVQQYMGDTLGKVYVKGKYTDSTLLNSDNGTAIHSNFELAPFSLGDLDAEGSLGRIVVFAERAQGVKLSARVIDKNSRVLTPYVGIGQLTKYVQSFNVDIRKGVLIQIAGAEYGSSPYWSILGMQLEIDRISKVTSNARS